MSETKDYSEEIKRLHKQACEDSQDFYTDPETGRMVFTRVFHINKGKCCESGCRHCPYGFRKEN